MGSQISWFNYLLIFIYTVHLSESSQLEYVGTIIISILRINKLQPKIAATKTKFKSKPNWQQTWCLTVCPLCGIVTWNKIPSKKLHSFEFQVRKGFALLSQKQMFFCYAGWLCIISSWLPESRYIWSSVVAYCWPFGGRGGEVHILTVAFPISTLHFYLLFSLLFTLVVLISPFCYMIIAFMEQERK